MTVICIECQKPIENATPTQELHETCYRARQSRVRREKNRGTTRGNVANGNIRTKDGPAKRLPRKLSVNFSDLMHAPAGKAVDMFNRILSGEMTVSG